MSSRRPVTARRRGASPAGAVPEGRLGLRGLALAFALGAAASFRDAAGELGCADPNARMEGLRQIEEAAAVAEAAVLSVISAPTPDGRLEARIRKWSFRQMRVHGLIIFLSEMPGPRRREMLLLFRRYPETVGGMFDCRREQRIAAFERVPATAGEAARFGPIITRMISDPDTKVARAAIACVARARLSSQPIIERLLDMLKATSRAAWTGRGGDPRRIALHREAAKALMELPSPGSSRVVAALLATDWSRCVERDVTLGEILMAWRDEKIIPVMEGLLSRRMPYIRLNLYGTRFEVAPSDIALMVISRIIGEDPRKYGLVFAPPYDELRSYGFGRAEDRAAAVERLKIALREWKRRTRTPDTAPSGDE